MSSLSKQAHVQPLVSLGPHLEVGLLSAPMGQPPSFPTVPSPAIRMAKGTSARNLIEAHGPHLLGDENSRSSFLVPLPMCPNPCGCVCAWFKRVTNISEEKYEISAKVEASQPVSFSTPWPCASTLASRTTASFTLTTLSSKRRQLSLV